VIVPGVDAESAKGAWKGSGNRKVFYHPLDAAASISAATSLRPGDVDRVTGARCDDRVALGSCGVPPFEVAVMILSPAATSIRLSLLLRAGAVMTRRT
jgi:hypothetical protein